MLTGKTYCLCISPANILKDRAAHSELEVLIRYKIRRELIERSRNGYINFYKIYTIYCHSLVVHQLNKKKILDTILHSWIQKLSKPTLNRNQSRTWINGEISKSIPKEAPNDLPPLYILYVFLLVRCLNVFIHFLLKKRSKLMSTCLLWIRNH